MANGHVCQSNLRFDARPPIRLKLFTIFASPSRKCTSFIFAASPKKQISLLLQNYGVAAAPFRKSHWPYVAKRKPCTHRFGFLHVFANICMFSAVFRTKTKNRKTKKIGRGISFRRNRLLSGVSLLGLYIMMGFCMTFARSKPTDHRKFVYCRTCWVY